MRGQVQNLLILKCYELSGTTVSPEAFARILCTGQLPVVHLGRKARIEDTALLAWLAARRPFQW
jgi:hypothetical protein